MELPIEVREQLIMMLDDYFETVNDEPDSSALAEFVTESIESAAEVSGVEDAEELIGRLEEDAELDDPLLDTLEYEFSSNDELELTGEEVVSLVEKICGIEWLEEDDDFDELEEDDLTDLDEED